MTAFLDLFSGIGGFALGAYWAGLRFDKHYFSEVDGYAIQVYQKRFPEAELLGDIRNVDYRKLPKGEWFVTGGFPCQPHSVAGKKQASKDERDLWPECRRMLCELRPTAALFENVPGLFISDGGRFFNGILSDIYQCGYDAEWQVISAAEVGAEHLRKRVWIVAHPRCEHGERCPNLRESEKETAGRQTAKFKRPVKRNTNETITNSGSKRIQGSGEEKIQRKSGLQSCEDIGSVSGEQIRPSLFEPKLLRSLNDVPFAMERLRGLGNAIVPKCAEVIFNMDIFDYWRGEWEVNL